MAVGERKHLSYCPAEGLRCPHSVIKGQKRHSHESRSSVSSFLSLVVLNKYNFSPHVTETHREMGSAELGWDKICNESSGMFRGKDNTKLDEN